MSIKNRKTEEKKKSMNILMGIAQGMVIILDILDSQTLHGGYSLRLFKIPHRVEHKREIEI